MAKHKKNGSKPEQVTEKELDGALAALVDNSTVYVTIPEENIIRGTYPTLRVAPNTYDDTEIRLQLSKVLSVQLPLKWAEYLKWVVENDPTEARWRHDFNHFVKWLEQHNG